MQITRMLSRVLAGPAALAVVALAACSDVVAPGDSLLVQTGMSLEELGQQVTTPARVDVTLRDGGVVAARVAIKTGDELAADERLSGAITGLTIDGDAAVLTLGYGVQFTVDHEAELAGAGADALTFEQFVGRIGEALALGREPRVEAVRPPPAEPQAPHDPAFRAAAAHLTDDAVPARLVLNVDQDNLLRVDPPPPDAILTLLGHQVEIRVSEGLTELILDRDQRHEFAFEGVVREVGPDRGLVVLHHGDRDIRLRVVDQTKLGLDGEVITSLDPIARARAAGQTVCAAGEGVQVPGQDALLAVVIRFHINPGPPELSFGGVVHMLDAEAGLLTLVEGPTVQIGGDTRLSINGEPVESLQRIVGALGAGLTVHAFGEGVAQEGSDVILAGFIRFEVDDGVPRVEFAGRVGAVDLEAGSFTIVEGPTIQVTDHTVFADGSAPATLGGVAEALGQGRAVYVAGAGELVAEAPRTIAASAVKFRLGD
jgi:hypothetical protein